MMQFHTIMEKIFKSFFAIAMVIMLMAGMAACSADDNQPEEVAQPSLYSTVHVTVGADRDEAALVKVTRGVTHTITFATTDQLYVRKDWTDAGHHYIAYGKLPISNIHDSKTKATFSGDLTIKKENVSDPDPTFILKDSEATLWASSLTGTDEAGYTFTPGLVATATKSLGAALADFSYIHGTIDASDKVTLLPYSAFLNCQIGNLKESTNYNVSLKNPDLGPISVTSDGVGQAHFIAWLPTGPVTDLKILISDTLKVELGSRTLETIVYNVNRPAWKVN